MKFQISNFIVNPSHMGSFGTAADDKFDIKLYHNTKLLNFFNSTYDFKVTTPIELDSVTVTPFVPRNSETTSYRFTVATYTPFYVSLLT